MAVRDERQFARLLVPVKKVVFGKGFFRWPKQGVLASPRTADIVALQQLSGDLSRHSLKSRLVRNAFGPAAVRIHRDRKITHREGYRIAIAPAGIEVYSETEAGAYYGLQTLREIVAIYGTVLPACKIEDEPDFRRRGVCHDCSRGKVPTLETLKNLVERLAHWKMNELQLYIEDVFSFKQHPKIGRGRSRFTAEQIISLQDHCRKHHVRLVGSLASFGHMERIVALPQYRGLGEMPGFRELPGGTTLCPGDPGSIKLIDDLYREFVPLFEAEDFNVCCDETWELGKGRSKRRAARIGVGGVYLDFLLKIHRLCARHGKRMNAWADMVLKYPQLLRKLPRDIVLLNWEYEADGANIGKTKEISRCGIPFMVCPGTSGWLTHGSRLANSMCNVSKFAAQGRKYGAEGLLNTDWGDQGHRNFLGVSLHGFAHAAGHAWHGRAVDESRFTENFCYHVFGGRTNRMAGALRLIGNTYLMCGKVYRNQSMLYHALVEPLLPAKSQAFSAIDNTSEDGLRRTLEQLSGIKLWPRPEKSTAQFERLALREFEVAGRMESLAAKRALAAKALRGGKTVERSLLRRLSKQMHEIAKDFRELWLSRNKTSRLRDNLKLFERAARESSRLSGGN
jgi:hypothetical protein